MKDHVMVDGVRLTREQVKKAWDELSVPEPTVPRIKAGSTLIFPKVQGIHLT